MKLKLNLKSVSLTEASKRAFMTNREKKLKKMLIDLLRDDGKGHHYLKYAERLKKFDVNIVSKKASSNFTAAVAFDTGIIYIGEGFLEDPSLFFQLSVLIRHELAHSLLMHQIRMMNHIGKDDWAHLKNSVIIQDLINIIADDEISNKKYSADDKRIVRNMILNGKVIGGLVTEDHRSGWKNLSIEEMYNSLSREIDTIKNYLVKNKHWAFDEQDYITKEILKTFIYTDINSDSILKGPIEKFTQQGCLLKGKKMRSDWVNIIKTIYDEFIEHDYKDDVVEYLLKKVATSSPIERIDLFDNKKLIIVSPEEKYITVETLKKFKSEYYEWFSKVEKVLKKYNKDDLISVLSVVQ